MNDLELRVSKLEDQVAKLLAGSVARPVSTVADDAELDSKYGNPDVRKDPPRWKGASQVGKRFSDCPPEFLDEFASFCDWKAGKDDEKNTDDGRKYAGYARKDAARARGWAARIRNGWQAKIADDGSQEIPF